MRSISVLALLLAAGTAAQAAPVDSRLAAALEGRGAGEPVAVILRFKGRVDPNEFQDRPPAERRGAMAEKMRAANAREEARIRPQLESEGARNIRALWLIHGLSLTLPAGAVERIARRPEVESISLDGTLAAPRRGGSASATPEWNLTMIQAPALWQEGFDGTGTVVGSLDTGVDGDHSDLTSRWRGGGNSWYDPNGEHSTPYDSTGHGTQTMGLMVGGDAGGTAIGVAPGAQWIAAKIFNDAGTASYSGIHLAFQWMLDPDGNASTDDAPDVVNNSWGLVDAAGQCINEFQQDIDTLRAGSIGVVFSAGNAGPAAGTSLSPANNAQSVSVGAVDDQGNVPDYSSRGPSACDGGLFPTLVAPGDNVRTADLTFGGYFPDSYVTVAGTSFAAPHVSGAVALLMSAVPGATAAQAETALRETAVDIGAAGPDSDSGAGLIDLTAAELRLQELASAPSPGTLQLSAESYSGAEESDAISVTVTRTGGSAGVVSVDYATADGTALSGTDYLTTAGTLTFADGETSRSFTVALVDDTTPEPDETFQVSLVNPAGTTLGWPAGGVVTITDGDTAPPPTNDLDGDGFDAPTDCNDNDASIYPGAPEVKHDGVDQDCNGYDLTIDITTASYSSRKGNLSVQATSDLGASASLELAGFGPMQWDKRRGHWKVSIRGVSPAPSTVTVQGVEGVESAPVN